MPVIRHPGPGVQSASATESESLRLSTGMCLLPVGTGSSFDYLPVRDRGVRASVVSRRDSESDTVCVRAVTVAVRFPFNLPVR